MPTTYVERDSNARGETDMKKLGLWMTVAVLVGVIAGIVSWQLANNVGGPGESGQNPGSASLATSNDALTEISNDDWQPVAAIADCDHDAYLRALWPLMERYSEVAEIGLGLPAEELGEVVDELAQIRQEAAALVDDHACEDLLQGNTYVLNALDAMRRAFVAYMNREPESSVLDLFQESETWIYEFQAHARAW
jgi:hypothetical protein